ncbi:hypothetical protein V2J09_021834 [Rumex salicifolius]
MNASVRILNPSIPTRIIFSKLQRHAPSLNLRHGRSLQFGAVNRKSICSGRVHSSLSLPFWDPVTLGLLLSAFSHHHNQHIYPENVNFLKSDPSVDAYGWSGDFRQLNGGTVPRDSNRLVMAVLLGWLGADPKHLKRYTEIYASRGINTLGFVVPVSEMLWFDLGRNVESRIERLVNDIVAWLMESEKDGKQRCLVFHTFSNTGWLVYGAILSRLQDRPELVARIKGCIVDSGGDPELNPKVWAAGFVTAILKKRSSAVYPVGEIGKMDPMLSVSKLQQKEPNLLENILLFVLEKLFSFLLCFPDIHQRLSKVITALSKNSPSCPQLYLYSTADMVIPFHSVESFMEEQRRMGRNVCSLNFQSSPHVDHFRTFPDLYSSKVSSFLDECLSMVKADVLYPHNPKLEGDYFVVSSIVQSVCYLF